MMKAKNHNSFIAICFLLLSCSNTRSSTDIITGNLPASGLHPFGRSILNNGKLELIGSAVHFGFTFEGSECRVFASIPDPAGHNYLQYELDGQYQRRIRVDGSTDQPIILTAGGKGRHTIWIYKATEATSGPVFIEKVTAKNIRSIQRPILPLIEFIGNSITAGAAADPSEVPCGKGQYPDQHNAYYAYGPRAARALGTNVIVSAVSGAGIYRHWNKEAPALPPVYENSDLQVNSLRRWDFSLYSPNIVSIALGTNDLSNGDGKTPRAPFDSAEYVSTFIKFIRVVKSKYPQAQIVLLNSPMINGNARAILQNCLTAVKANVDQLYKNDKPVILFFFKAMQAKGCTGHPSVEDHAILAGELIPFFKKLL